MAYKCKYFKTLEITSEATPDEVDKAFVKHLKQASLLAENGHPSQVVQKLGQLSEAYSILGDPVVRLQRWFLDLWSANPDKDILIRSMSERVWEPDYQKPQN